MMKRIFLLILLMLLLSACARPKLAQWTETPISDEQIAACAAPFQTRPFRVVHRIDTKFSVGEAPSLLGVSLADPAGQRLRSMLLSAEGLLLFDATATLQDTVVHRALPPLDRAAFAMNLLNDVRLLLLPPTGKLLHHSKSADLVQRCVYQDFNGFVETSQAQDGPLTLRRYDNSKTLQKQAVLHFDEKGRPSDVFLQVWGSSDYSLSLDAVEASWVEEDESLGELFN